VGDRRRGLGPYGAGVVALAEGRQPDSPPVDKTTARVVSHLNGWMWARGEPRKKPEVADAMTEVLGNTPPEHRLELVYALVDLGESICRLKKTPSLQSMSDLRVLSLSWEPEWRGSFPYGSLAGRHFDITGARVTVRIGLPSAGDRSWRSV
jgi:hypothetical protein